MGSGWATLLGCYGFHDQKIYCSTTCTVIWLQFKVVPIHNPPNIDSKDGFDTSSTLKLAVFLPSGQCIVQVQILIPFFTNPTILKKKISLSLLPFTRSRRIIILEEPPNSILKRILKGRELEQLLFTLALIYQRKQLLVRSGLTELPVCTRGVELVWFLKKPVI